MIRWLLSLALIASTACATSQPPALPAPGSTTPSLVVVLVVDQMRTDYIDSGLPHFTGGLRRLATEGAWFRSAAYRTWIPITCAGHATIGTGSLPYRHGMVLNAWWDRKAGQSMPCTSDSTVRNIGYTGRPAGGDSPRSLLAATFAETVARPVRRKDACLFPEAAVDDTGRRAWRHRGRVVRRPGRMDDIDGLHPDQASVARQVLHPTIRLRRMQGGRGTERSHPRRTRGWTMEPANGRRRAGQTSRTSWRKRCHRFHRAMAALPRSLDEYLGRLAASAISELELGHGKGIDFISVSFSSLDLVGHLFGPASRKVQDLVLRLDRTAYRRIPRPSRQDSRPRSLCRRTECGPWGRVVAGTE